MGAYVKSSLMFVAAIGLAGCTPGIPDRDYREDMRQFVIKIAEQARTTDPGFIVIPQNGQELLTTDGEASGPLAADYFDAIDGQAREDLFYGYARDDQATRAADRDYLLGFLDGAVDEGLPILVTDYCSTRSKVDDSYAQNAAHNFLSFAAHRRELDAVPPYPATPVGENNQDIATLSDASNFLYLINPGAFADKASFITALQATNYDVLLLDAFFDDEPLAPADLVKLKTKANGAQRLVIAYMSIGEAEDYRFYWQPGWRRGSPAWIEAENTSFPGNFIVRYWEPEWQAIILDPATGYLARIQDAGFDGVYLDIIDAFEYFE